MTIKSADLDTVSTILVIPLFILSIISKKSSSSKYSSPTDFIVVHNIVNIPGLENDDPTKRLLNLLTVPSKSISLYLMTFPSLSHSQGIWALPILITLSTIFDNVCVNPVIPFIACTNGEFSFSGLIKSFNPGNPGNPL